MFSYYPRQHPSNHHPHPSFGATSYHAPCYDLYYPYSSSRPHPYDPNLIGYDSDDSEIMDPNSYRRLALEHRRKAEAAMALAQEQELRNRDLQRRLALDRLRSELGGQYSPAHLGFDDARHHIVSAPSERRNSVSAGCVPPYPESPYRVTLDDEIRSYLQRQRRERERQEALKTADQVKRAQSPRSSSPRQQAAQNLLSKDEPWRAAQQNLPVPKPNDLASQLRNALSEGRSEEEKDTILGALGLMPPTTAERPETQDVQRQRTPPVPIVVYDVEASPFKRAGSPKPVQHAPRPAQPAIPKTRTTSSISPHFAALDAIQTKFDDLRSAFVFPSYVEFGPAGAGPATPKLLYNSINGPVLQYESELIKLLTRLDAIESGGAEAVRGARKALVLAVERELDQLEQAKDAVWAKQQQREEAALPSRHTTATEGSDAVSEVQMGEVSAEQEKEEEPVAREINTDGSGTKVPGEDANDTAPVDASDAARRKPEPTVVGEVAAETPSESMHVGLESSQPEPVADVPTDYEVEEAAQPPAATAEGPSDGANVPEQEVLSVPAQTLTNPSTGQADANVKAPVEPAAPSTERTGAEGRDRTAEGDHSSGSG